MEQNNYAVGEQRERDTKGWSDSEANKLRSLRDWNGVEVNARGRVVSLHLGGYTDKGRELSWNGPTSSTRSVEANKWRSFFAEAGWSSPTSSTPPSRASDSEVGLRQRTGSASAPRFTGMFEMNLGSCQTKMPRKERLLSCAQVISTSSHGRFYFSHGPKRLKVRRVRSRTAVESVCGQGVNPSLSQPTKYIPLTVHKAPEFTKLRPSGVCAVWF